LKEALRILDDPIFNNISVIDDDMVAIFIWGDNLVE